MNICVFLGTHLFGYISLAVFEESATGWSGSEN